MALISISGRKGSGKDLVGKIITWMVYHPQADIEWVKQVFDKSYIPKEGSPILGKTYPQDLPWFKSIRGPQFEIKKFADPLKDMVCILLGCTREQLEDRDFKEKELGEEWWYYDYRPEKWAMNKAHLVPYAEGRNTIYESYEIVKLSPRKILQLLGTDCVRNIIHPQAWVNALFSKWKGEAVVYNKYTKQQKLLIEHPNWIITDTRFPNELQAVKDRGGLTIRVNRSRGTLYKSNVELSIGDEFILEGIPVKVSHIAEHQDSYYIVRTDLHESETALDDATFDYVIDNDGTIEELIHKVREILVDANIIEHDG